MKKIQKAFKVFAVVFMFIVCFASVTSANEIYKYKITTLGNNKWSVKHVDSDYKFLKNEDMEITCYLNKIVIPEDGYLHFEKTSSRSEGFFLFKDYKKYIEEDRNDGMYIQFKEYCPIEKGTYYIFQDTYSYKFVYKKSVNRANYSASTALSLSSNKTVNIVQTPMFNYNRWYRIKIGSKKVISVVLKYGVDHTVSIFNSKGKIISTAKSGTKIYTYEAQKAGTYYIRISSTYDSSENENFYGSFTSFYWK